MPAAERAYGPSCFTALPVTSEGPGPGRVPLWLDPGLEPYDGLGATREQPPTMAEAASRSGGWGAPMVPNSPPQPAPPPGSDRRPRAVVSWSSGKDSAFALAEVRRAGTLDVVGLLTTVTREYARVSMHGVREELLERQSKAAGLPLEKVEIPATCPNTVYEQAMGEALARLRAAEVEVVVFGDLFLEDIRRYREARLQGTGLRPEFPLWGRPTADLARRMIASGLRATLVCVDPRQLPARFAGRAFDAALLEELPAGVDLCGERGEFHTFVTDGPMFTREVPVTPGPVVEREGFVFADLLPADPPPSG